MNNGENSVGVYMGVDMACVLKRGTCLVTWMHDVSQNETRGVSGGYGSVEH